MCYKVKARPDVQTVHNIAAMVYFLIESPRIFSFDFLIFSLAVAMPAPNIDIKFIGKSLSCRKQIQPQLLQVC
jgi:hypothetical protein